MAINTPPAIPELVVCANVFIHTDDTYLLLKRSPQKKFYPNVLHILNPKSGTFFATFKYDSDRKNIIEAEMDICAR